MLFRLLHALSLIAAVLAVLLGPPSISAAEAAMVSPPAVTDAMAAMGMPDQMPCCPKPKPDTNTCGKGCVFSLACGSSFAAQAEAKAILRERFPRLRQTFDPIPHAELRSLTGAPPHRPPKV